MAYSASINLINACVVQPMSVRKLKLAKKFAPPGQTTSTRHTYTTSPSTFGDTSRELTAIQITVLISMPPVCPTQPEYVLGVVESRIASRDA